MTWVKNFLFVLGFILVFVFLGLVAVFSFISYVEWELIYPTIIEEDYPLLRLFFAMFVGISVIGAFSLSEYQYYDQDQEDY